jgi:hypothetical protein
VDVSIDLDAVSSKSAIFAAHALNWLVKERQLWLHGQRHNNFQRALGGQPMFTVMPPMMPVRPNITMITGQGFPLLRWIS